MGQAYTLSKILNGYFTVESAYNTHSYPLQAFTTFFDDLKSINLNQQKSQLQATFKEMSSSVEKLKGNEKQAIREIKDIIRYVKKQQKIDDDMERYFR